MQSRGECVGKIATVRDRVHHGDEALVAHETENPPDDFR